MLYPNTSEILEIIEAVEQFERKWIPDDLKKPGTTFFSPYDYWVFIEHDDGKLCNRCYMISLMGLFLGSELRLMFPYLEIIDEDTIKANIHPNCRCILRRLKIVL